MNSSVYQFFLKVASRTTSWALKNTGLTTISLKFRVPNVKNVSNPESHLLLNEKSMSGGPLAPPTTADYADWSRKEQEQVATV